MLKLFEYDIEKQVTKMVEKNSQNIQLFLIIFMVNLLIFGQKLFFYTVISDDYMRFYGDHNTKLLVTNSARWAQALLNKYLFIGNLQILPYLHGIVGIFSITLMGYLTAKYFERKKKYEIVIATLLISATPMFAHNLLFSTNITTWLSLLLGLIGFFMIEKGGKVNGIIGFVLMVFSIGNYQTFIQIIIVMIFIKAILKLFRAETKQDIKKIIIHAIFLLLLLVFAYILSFLINDIFLYYHHWHKEHRLAIAIHNSNLTTLFENIVNTYSTFINFNYFKKQLDVLYGLSAILALLGSLFFILNRSIVKSSKIIIFVLILFLFFVTPLVVNLPQILGVNIPIRAHIAVGWGISGFFALQMQTLKNFFKMFAYLLALSILVVSIYYISVLYDVANRQTQADIIRANMVVERIRTSNNYVDEPIGFYILGQKQNSVIGWKNLMFQQPFNSKWAKYKIFRYFT
ncbi:MAG: hypothetical protein DSZ12_04225, partial [Sulfurovum sp.]